MFYKLHVSHNTKVRHFVKTGETLREREVMFDPRDVSPAVREYIANEFLGLGLPWRDYAKTIPSRGWYVEKNHPSFCRTPYGVGSFLRGADLDDEEIEAYMKCDIDLFMRELARDAREWREVREEYARLMAQVETSKSE